MKNEIEIEIENEKENENRNKSENENKSSIIGVSGSAEMVDSETKYDKT
jgi:hypothetical protein